MSEGSTPTGGGPAPPHAVHDVDRVAAGVDRTHTADTQRRGAARTSGERDVLHAGDLARDALHDVEGRGAFGEVFVLHGSHRRGEVAFGQRTVADHHHLVDAERAGGHRDVDLRPRADGDLLGLHADERELEHLRSGRNAECVGAVARGHFACGRTFRHDGHAGDGGAALVRDDAFDDGVLRLQRGRRCQDGQHRDKQIPCGSAQDTHALEACFYASFLVHVGTFDLIDGFFVCCVPEPGVESGVRRGAGKTESVVFHRLFLLGYGFEIGFAGHGGASVPGGGTDAQGARRTGAGVRSAVGIGYDYIIRCGSCVGCLEDARRFTGFADYFPRWKFPPPRKAGKLFAHAGRVCSVRGGRGRSRSAGNEVVSEQRFLIRSVRLSHKFHHNISFHDGY